MVYDTSNDPYLIENTDVLRNTLGINDKVSLAIAEAEISSVTIATMTLPIGFKIADIDTDFYCSIHHEIFTYIYDWAGAVRTIDISVESSLFAHAAYVNEQLDRTFAELRNDDRLTSHHRKDVLDAMTYYYEEINAIHPFREGNGRTLRTFLRLLASRVGWDFDWSRMDPVENIKASEQSLKSDPILLRNMLDALLETLT